MLFRNVRGRATRTELLSSHRILPQALSASLSAVLGAEAKKADIAHDELILFKGSATAADHQGGGGWRGPPKHLNNPPMAHDVVLLILGRGAWCQERWAGGRSRNVIESDGVRRR